MTSLDPRAQKGAGIYIFSREKVNNFLFSRHFISIVDKNFFLLNLWIKIISDFRIPLKPKASVQKLSFLSGFIISNCFIGRFNIVVGMEPVLGKTGG